MIRYDNEEKKLEQFKIYCIYYAYYYTYRARHLYDGGVHIYTVSRMFIDVTITVICTGVFSICFGYIYNAIDSKIRKYKNNKKAINLSFKLYYGIIKW